MGLIRFIVTFIIIYLIFRFIRKVFFGNKPKQAYMSGQRTATSIGEDLVEDPYCHTYIPLSSAYRASVDGRTVYFCSKKCFEEYAAKLKKGL